MDSRSWVTGTLQLTYYSKQCLKDEEISASDIVEAAVLSCQKYFFKILIIEFLYFL